MGLQLKDLIIKKEIALSDLAGKTLAVDSMNILYQFLTTIRGPDGSVLTDHRGHVTSHLIGLFNRTTSLMEQGIKLIFVFDGKPPQLKQKTWEKRSAVKAEASLKLKVAEEAGDYEEMRKFASRTTVLTKEMITDAQALITLLGLPIIQAPSEGEAQAAHVVKKGHAYAVVSQDYDTLLFGCPRVVRNLSIEGRRKKAGTVGFQTVKPELVDLKDVLAHLQITQEQLVHMAMLMGTDYNPGGIKGIGPKKALTLSKQYSFNDPALFDAVQWSTHFPDLSWQELHKTITTIPVTDDYALSWKPCRDKEIQRLLIEEHGFSADRVHAKLEKLYKSKASTAQEGLSRFF
ncbi:TPA: flap endonuclease-1 [Candidatus Woesearchaeota archaeon]|nr:flap endonuclease-1 [Candidatus Woesearchaeota archaeon]